MVEVLLVEANIHVSIYIHLFTKAQQLGKLGERGFYMKGKAEEKEIGEG